jgi:guanosine-3',5'-bis(diphosphate) 3'-pyrophosphohydrolase
MNVQSCYQEAIKFAALKHMQKRQKVPGTKLPYLVHVCNVAMEILVAASHTPDFDPDFAVQVGLLHDTIEDTSTTFEEISDKFGLDVANGVLALTKNEMLPKEQQIPDSLARIKKLRKEVWAVKLADRITNLQPPPANWSRQKRTKYLEDARLILEEMKNGNAYLADRLRSEIEKYKQYL